MKLLKTTLLVSALAVALTGCSSKAEQRDIKLTDESKLYSKTKAIYCEGSKVASFYGSEDFISIRCEDESSKVIFMD